MVNISWTKVKFNGEKIVFSTKEEQGASLQTSEPRIQGCETSR